MTQWYPLALLLLALMQAGVAEGLRRRRRLVAAAVLMLSAGLLAGSSAGLIASNALAGCWPWSPKVVEFYQGMTLCPGQRAVFRGVIKFDGPPGKDI